jgi:hypothetical protein
MFIATTELKAVFKLHIRSGMFLLGAGFVRPLLWSLGKIEK